ncbi:MAG: hypothetical protein NT154_14955 [Verrucomicrobia bacterium]|nr:hypothetical protein [Verrucomicrobiota bacterium]
MTAPELIDALHRAGATLVVADGKTRARGAKVTDELMAALKGQRAEVIAEWRRRQEKARDRYAVVPSGEVPMCGWDMALPAAEREAVMVYVFRQPRPVHAWVMARANDYYERGVKANDCEWRACVDLIAWQRACGGREAVEFVVDLPANEELGVASKGQCQRGISSERHP